MTIIKKWKYKKDINYNAEYNLNSSLAKKCSKNGTLDFLCDKYTDINKNDIISILSIIPDAKNIFKGNGIDIGGGPGLVSATLINNYKNINKIILLEIVEEVLELCYPIVKDKYLIKNKKNNLIPISGSFDEIQLNDNSLQFAIAWDAMHHSLNPIKTLKEINRVLSKKGFFIIIDRAHDNKTSDSEINRLLNIQYNEEFIRKNGLPTGTKLTRSQNGEHEYRFNNWESFFKHSKFEIKSKTFIIERHPRNDNYINDANIKQLYVDNKIGGFERRKIIYVLQSI